MSFKEFTESEVNKSFLKKIDKDIFGPPRNNSHPIYKLEYKGTVIGIVRIPNPYKNTFIKRKAKHLAESINITSQQYNEIVSCVLKKDELTKVIINNNNS
jgi:hypothetical protein